jgi:hypothetical protein
VPIPLYQASVPAFRKHLEALDAILDKAVVYADEKRIDHEALLGARLYPDMYNLRKQVQSACDFAKLCVARLGGITPPVHDDSEKSFADLKRRISETLAVLDSATPDAVNGADAKSFTVKAGPRELHFADGGAYLMEFALPNFLFHCATAYGILRHNGLEIGKRDFMRRLQPAQ